MTTPAGRREQATRGVLYALAAYGLWGGNPLFFRLLDGASAFEIVAHRALWSLPVAALLLIFTRRLGAALAPLRSFRALRILIASALFISINWGFFVWAVNAGRTMEASLGYYINPLMNVLVGFLFLGERFSRPQIAAIALACAAVIWLTVSAGVFPWLALLLAASFTMYGFLRKIMPAGPLEGLFVETIVLFPLALALLFILWKWGGQPLKFGNDSYYTTVLMIAGPVTVTPLLFFAAGARRIRLSTLGLMQYIAPTGMFLTAVFIFGDPLDNARLIAFALIWTALLIYSWDAMRQEKAARSEKARDS